MPNVVTHAAVPLARGLGLGGRFVPARLLVVGVVAAVLPDVDVLGYKAGVAFSDILGHRGVTHSLLFAAAVALGVGAAARLMKAGSWLAGLFVFACVASHGLLDMLTTGGSGIALYWPWSEQRLFFPFRMIRVSPFSPGAFLSQRGIDVIVSELVWVWLPSAAAMLVLALSRLGKRFWFHNAAADGDGEGRV